MTPDNPVLARVLALVAEGQHPMAVRLAAAGRGRWTLTVTLDDTGPPGECLRGVAPKAGTLPGGVLLKGWERFPDDVSEVRGSAEAVETWLAEVARQGKAVDWARFDADAPGYPAYLTKPAAWLRPSNPYHPAHPANPANKYPDFASRLRGLREAAGLSVAALASTAGLSRQAVHQYEDGRRQPTWQAVQQLAAALNVPTDTFRDPVK